MGVRIAIDTGGTFTDLVLVDTDSPRLVFHKVPSTPDDPGRALIAGIAGVVEKAGVDPQAVELLVHGTTVATNTILQRRGARTAFITTRGFRDVLQIQRQDRPALYSLRARRTPALIPRQYRFELDERIRFDGTVETPADRTQLAGVVDALRDAGIASVGVGLLNSHVNPAHERLVGETLRARLPEIEVCLSHALVQEEGEYERFSTCAMNAYLQPVIARYLTGIDRALTRAGIGNPLFVMKSNGGTMTAATGARQAVHTILSGPAGGVVAGHHLAEMYGRRHLITADMGGTSFDVAIMHDGRIAFAQHAEIGRLALKVPMLDIHTVGAGGGSIAWVDAGGALRVGPQSAGARPGPACYGSGGDEPTVTDANLVLGRLSEHTLLSGALTLDREAGRRVIADRIAAPLGLSVERAAEGIVQVVNATMTAAIRKLTVERGYDPRSFTLCPFGGAGPLHAAELAREMGIREVLVPLAPGVTSAAGLLAARLREDRVRTHVKRMDRLKSRELEALFAQLAAEAEIPLADYTDRYPARRERRLGMRYLGQGYSLMVDLPAGPIRIERAVEDFHASHERQYGFSRKDQTVELVTLWMSVEVDMGTVRYPEAPERRALPEPKHVRPVYFSGRWIDTPVYERETLGAGCVLTGPAVIEQMDATTLLWPGQKAEVNRWGQILLHVEHFGAMAASGVSWRSPVPG